MKKALMILLAVIFCLSFSACTPGVGGGTDRTAAPEGSMGPETMEACEGWNFDNRLGNGIDSVIETADAYYYNGPRGRFIYYYDKASGISGVLCGKPECVHDAIPENHDCNGYAYIIGKVAYWGGRLRFLTLALGTDEGCAIMSMKPDGTDRRVDTYTSAMIGDVYYTPLYMDFHRGMYYCCDTVEIVDDGVPTYETCIFTIDPETGEIKKLYSTDSAYQDPSLFYYGKYVYFYLGRIEESKNGDRVTLIELRRYDTETKEIEDVFISPEDGSLGSRMNIWVESEDLIYIMPNSLQEGEPFKLYKLENGKLSAVVTFDTEGSGAIVGGAAFVGYPNERTMEIRRFDGSLIYEGEWKLDLLSELGSGAEASYHVSSVYGDENELFIGMMLWRQSEKDPMSFCLLKYDLTGGEPQATVLCYDPRN